MRSSRALGVVAGVLLAGVVTACGGDDAKSADGFCDAAKSFVVESDKGDGLFSGDEIPTPEATEAAFGGVGSAITEMAGEAPDDIKADVEMVAATMTDLVAVLERSNWDFMAATSDPEFAGISDSMDSAEMSAAQDRVDAYAKSECDVTLGS